MAQITQQAQLLQLPLDQLAPDPDQPRTDFDDTALGELAASLAAIGQIEPVQVIRNPDLEERRKHPYRILVGERRWRAAKLAGLETIDAILRKEAPERAERLFLQIEENDKREGLSVLDRARAVERALAASDLSKKEFARKLGRSHTWLSIQLTVAASTGACLEALERGLIADTETARQFSRLDEGEQRRLLGQAMRESAPITRSLVERLAKRKAGSGAKATGDGAAAQVLADGADGTPQTIDAAPSPAALVPLGEVPPRAFAVLLRLLGADESALPSVTPESLPLLLEEFRARLAERAREAASRSRHRPDPVVI